MRQLPRMFCSTAAAAPGLPSTSAYVARATRRVNTSIVSRRLNATASGIVTSQSPVTSATPTPMAIGTRNVRSSSGMISLS
jgi:hypothetical protein